MNYFDNINEFYESFYKILDKDLKNFLKKNQEEINETKRKYNFYSYEDIKFRLVRDKLLTNEEYIYTMSLLMKKSSLDFV